jgi:hypothetical protein
MRRCGVLLLALGACSSSTATPDLAAFDRSSGGELTAARDLALEARADHRRDGPRPPAHWKTIAGASLALEGISVTPLATGELLLVGGYTKDSNGDKLYSQKAYRYQPQSDTLLDAGSLAAGRAYHAATRLPDGSVLVTGGETASSSYVLETELFDPQKPAGSGWSAGPPLPQARRGGHALALPNGMMISGGTTNGTFVLETVVFFKPGSGWSLGLTPLKEKRREHTTLLLDDEKVLIAGGARGGFTTPDYLDSLEVYDLKSGTSAIVPSPMSKNRAQPSLTRLDDGRVLIVGGYCGTTCTGKFLDDLYDPKTDAITPITHPGSFPSRPHIAVKLLDGRVLITANAPGADHQVVAFQPSPPGWETLPQIPHPRSLASGARLPDGSVLVVGGLASETPTVYAPELERFFP